MVDFNRGKEVPVPHDTSGTHDAETCAGCMLSTLFEVMEELLDTQWELQKTWENIGAEKDRVELMAELYSNVQRTLRVMCLANVAFNAIKKAPDTMSETLWKLDRTTAYMSMLGACQMYLKFLRVCYAAIGEKPPTQFDDFEHLDTRVTAMADKLVEMAKRRGINKNLELMELVKRFYQIPNEPITT